MALATAQAGNAAPVRVIGDRFIESRHVATEGGRVHFDGLTFDRTGPDALIIHVRTGSRDDGTPRDEPFVYQPVRDH